MHTRHWLFYEREVPDLSSPLVSKQGREARRPRHVDGPPNPGATTFPMERPPAVAQPTGPTPPPVKLRLADTVVFVSSSRCAHSRVSLRKQVPRYLVSPGGGGGGELIGTPPTPMAPQTLGDPCRPDKRAPVACFGPPQLTGYFRPPSFASPCLFKGAGGIRPWPTCWDRRSYARAVPELLLVGSAPWTPGRAVPRIDSAHRRL